MLPYQQRRSGSGNKEMGDVFDSVFGVVLTAMATALGWIWTRIDTTNTMTQNNNVRLNAVEKELEIYQKVPERMTAIETTMSLNFQYIKDTMARMEAHMIRQQSKGKPDIVDG